MKRAAYGLSLAAAALLVAAVPSQAGAHGGHGDGWHGHHWHRRHSPRVVVGIGSAFWGLAAGLVVLGLGRLKR